MDCYRGNWQSWSSCDKSCGGGVKSRMRSVIQPAVCGGRECEGSDTEIGHCGTYPCPGKPQMIMLYVDSRMIHEVYVG